MICESCKVGADIQNDSPLALIAKENWHKQCKGKTRCDCQHRVGRKNVQ